AAANTLAGSGGGGAAGAGAAAVAAGAAGPPLVATVAAGPRGMSAPYCVSGAGAISGAELTGADVAWAVGGALPTGVAGAATGAPDATGGATLEAPPACAIVGG
ncbi:hypothetical protein LV457_10825, partial [Mycobacterium sp. MYCO198283]|nr:hypothetical protein [Mycobacterium sp. MYCO198283]